jgi:hypothetical protein
MLSYYLAEVAVYGALFGAALMLVSMIVGFSGLLLNLMFGW